MSRSILRTVLMAAAWLVAATTGAPPAAGAESSVELTPATRTIAEGASITMVARFSPAGTEVPARFLFDWGDGTVTNRLPPAVPPYTVRPSHAYGDEGTYRVRVSVTGAGLDPVEDTAVLTVVNAPPVLVPLPDTVAPLGEVFGLAVTWTDPGRADTHRAVVDWGDGASAEREGITDGRVAFSHVYRSVGTRSVVVRVEDGDGGADEVRFTADVELSCGGRSVTIDARSAPPGPVLGTPGPDVILGSPGPDVISGLGGADVICGKGGADSLDGGPGDDLLIGGAGADALTGGPGRDTLVGNGRADHLEGEDGPDVLSGGAGADTLIGGHGDDVLAGGRGGDSLQGGPGRDVLHGGAGADQLAGQEDGDFLFRSESPSRDRMDGGPGEDVVDVGRRGTETTGIRNHLTQGEALAFQGSYLLAEFTTYHDCCQNRVVNIQLMADTVHGHLVMPGETFSVNATVGRRTTAKGYLPAGAIIGGYVQCCGYADNIGGGTSQFGTTIYNAVFFAGLEDVEHRPHSLDFARYPDGREATMGYPHPDVAFRNDTDHPVLITTHHTGRQGTSITVKVWGDNGGRQVTAGASARRNVHHTDRVVEEIDYSLGCGRFYVKTAAQPGFTIDVFRYIDYADGTRTTEKWTWSYSAGPEVRRVGYCAPATDDGGDIPSSDPGGGGLLP
jgi:hypothetical protein